MQVYVVTAGIYSDYHVEGVFSTPEKAAEYMAARKAIYPASYEDFNDVLVLDVDDGDADLVVRMAAQGLTAWLCWVSLDGAHIETDQSYSTDRVYPSFEWDRPFDGTGRAVARCFARDREHAIKIAAEMYAKAVAERDQGVTTPG